MQDNSFENRVLYEDNHLLIVNKLPSEIVQGDKTGDEPMVDFYKRYLKKKYNKKGDVFLGVVHRLDRPVSGVVVFARTSKALSRMNELVRDRNFHKTYWAVSNVCPSPEAATLEHYLLKNTKQNKSYVVAETRPDARLAKLSYKLLSSSERYYLIEVELHTGRHHQIRAQLAAIGCPIKGDLKYGFNRPNKNGSIHLHSRSLSFVHPVKKEPLIITADTPNDALWNFFSEEK